MAISTDKKWTKGRSKHLTGFCNENGKPGQHEGTKPKDWRGVPMITCPFWETCPCECHKNVDFLFEATGMERREVPNPEYIPDHGNFAIPVMVDDPLGTVASSVDGVITPPTMEQTSTVPPQAAQTPLAQRRTVTGRAARGGLEAQVWDACTHFLDLGKIEGEVEFDDPITPKLVCEWIADRYKIPTPSSGAVNAVWDRWEKLGFAKTAKKPNRFLGFEGESSWDHLTRLKGSSKRLKKTEASLALRGFRKK